MTFTQRNKPVLEASTPDVRHFANVLRGVTLGSAQRATIQIIPPGISIIVEEAKTLLAQAIIPKSTFESFAYHPPLENDDEAGVSFEIELNSLLTILDIFGAVGTLPAAMSGGKFSTQGRRGNWKERDDDEVSNAQADTTEAGIARFFSATEKGGKLTGMRMTYIGEGHPLSLTLSEESTGPITTCTINTLEPEPSLDLPFDDNDKLVKIIMKSAWLSEALSELDNSCEKLTIICSPSAEPLPLTSTGTTNNEARPTKSGAQRDHGARPTFRLLGVSAYGSTEIDYPNDRDVLQSFECEERTQFSYRFTHISRITRALHGSLRTSLRINEEGTLSVQMMMPVVKVRGTDSANPFIEFRCLALDDDVG